jgi:hypothetical protein
MSNLKHHFKKLDVKSIEDNEGKHKAQCATLHYKNSRRQYSLNDIENELRDTITVMQMQKRNGWCSITVFFGGKAFGTPLNISYKINPNKINISELIYDYYDSYFNATDNPFTSNRNLKIFPQFFINLATIQKGGKADDDELCFYHRLEELGCKSFLNSFTEPSFLYSFFKLKYRSPITLKHAIAIAKKCNFNLHVVGDSVYEPVEPNSLYPHYNLTLKDGHWSHTINEKKSKVIDKQGIIFTFPDESKKVVFRDEKHKKEVDFDSKDAFLFYGHIKVEDEKEMNDIVKEYHQIYELSKGKYNIFKYGDKINFIRAYFNNKLDNYDVDPIEQYEYKFIEKATRRPHCFCKPGTYEKVYYCDVKKAFASILGNSFFKIPIKKGKVTTFTQKEADEIIKKKHNFIYGIYKAHIDGEDKRFVYNPRNYYTSIDLNSAVELGLPIKIREKEGNALIYKCNESCICSKSLFWEFVQDFYEYSTKTKDNKTIKFCMSCLWGVLSQVNKKWVKYVEDMTLPKNSVICNIEQDKDGNTNIATFNYLKPYKSPLARMKAFILAEQRENMIGFFGDNIEDISYCRTDGIYSTKELGFKADGELGDLVLKGTYSNVVIKSCNDIKDINGGKPKLIKA